MSKQRSLLKELGYSVFVKMRARIAHDCGMVCAFCGVEVVIGPYGGRRLATIAHKTPLSRGGSWKRYNLTCACKACNNEKANMTSEEFMDWRLRISRASGQSPSPASPSPTNP